MWIFFISMSTRNKWDGDLYRLNLYCIPYETALLGRINMFLLIFNISQNHRHSLGLTDALIDN